LDAPDSVTEPPSVPEPQAASGPKRKPPGRILNRAPVLPPERSAGLLDQLLDELGRLEGSEVMLA
jgi:hypothetical protein